jgi:hypothetical protein
MNIPKNEILEELAGLRELFVKNEWLGSVALIDVWVKFSENPRVTSEALWRIKEHLFKRHMSCEWSGVSRENFEDHCAWSARVLTQVFHLGRA